MRAACQWTLKVSLWRACQAVWRAVQARVFANSVHCPLRLSQTVPIPLPSTSCPPHLKGAHTRASRVHNATLVQALTGLGQQMAPRSMQPLRLGLRQLARRGRGCKRSVTSLLPPYQGEQQPYYPERACNGRDFSSSRSWAVGSGHEEECVRHSEPPRSQEHAGEEGSSCVPSLFCITRSRAPASTVLRGAGTGVWCCKSSFPLSDRMPRASRPSSAACAAARRCLGSACGALRTSSTIVMRTLVWDSCPR